jgi:hypothetical protein
MISKNKLFLILLIFCISFLFSNYTSAFEAEVSLNTNNLNIYDKDVNLEINVYNNTNTEQLYGVIPHITPFKFNLDSSTFRLSPRASKRVVLVINPIGNSLEKIYSTKLEVTSNFSSTYIPLQITQNTNKECNIDLDYTVVYNPNIKKYVFNLKLENKDNYSKFVELIHNSILKMDFSRKIELNAKEYKELKFVFDSNVESIDLEYNCNNIELNCLNIILPNKPKDDINTNNNSDNNNAGYNNSNLSGLLNLGFFTLNINNILNSLAVQIILIIVLIVLVLSFTTKYIKFIYNK